MRPIATNATQKKPKRTSDHVYAIIRYDAFQGAETPIENKIAIKAIFWDADSAQKEIDRLNKLQAGKNVYYFLQIARLERRAISRPMQALKTQVTNMAAPSLVKVKPNQGSAPYVMQSVKQPGELVGGVASGY
jgi:hypothetical protein